MNSESNGSAPMSMPTDPSTETTPQPPAARFVALPRRVFGLRLLGAVPLAIAAAAAVAQPETAQAGTDGDWTLTGNSLPDATKFLGSTNAQALTIKTSNTTRMTITSSGNVGIGTAAPANKFHVAAVNTAIRGESSVTGGTSYGVIGKSAAYYGRGVYGEASSTSTGTSYGVYGKSASSSGTGVYGEATATSGNMTGVEGRTNGSGGYGVRGLALGSSGNTYGVWGQSNSSNGTGVLGEASDSNTSNVTEGVLGRSYSTGGRGVWGAAVANSGITYGVYGNSNSSGGVGVYGTGGYAGVEGEGDLYGVRGEATGASGNGVLGIASEGTGPYGVWGITYAASGYAGYFNGRVHVNGTLSKSAGSFMIDHPLDPANQYLTHSFVESPDMLNVYNGNVTLGVDGRAEVKLPAYFEALNRDFRYQLTAIGAPGPNLHVAKEIAGNRFTIAGGEAGMKVSWQITGVRDDAYARAHPIGVEQPKPEHERGTYLTPEEHGQPETKSVNYAKLQRMQEREREVAAARQNE